MFNWLSSQSVQGRLLLIFSGLILVGAVGIGVIILAVSHLQTRANENEQQNTIIHQYAELESLLLQQELALYQYAQTSDGAYLRQYSNLERSIDLMLFSIIQNNPEGIHATSLRRIAADLEILHRKADDLLEISWRNNIAQDIFVEEIAREHTDTSAGVRQRLQDIARLEKETIASTWDEIAWGATLIVLGGSTVLASFVGFVVLVALVVDDLTDPLLTLVASVNAYKNDSYYPDMLKKHRQREDELGLLTVSLEQLIATIQSQKEAQARLLASAMRFFPSAYLTLLQKRNIEEIQLGDHVSAEMAVLFSDIRSFTTASEKMAPAQNFQFINDYLHLVSPLVQKYNGFVVKFLGDGVMAVFPYRVDDALQAAIAKLGLVHSRRSDFLTTFNIDLDIGIGIHTGHMMVGMIGEEHRLQGDAFSDNVNLTARIESLTRFFQVSLIISAETLARLEYPGHYKTRPLGLVQVKGRARPISLFEVFDADPPEARKAKEQTLEGYEAAVKAYRLGQFDDAITLFERILSVFPDDHPSQIFLERARNYRAHGAPANWEGVEVMESK